MDQILTSGFGDLLSNTLSQPGLERMFGLLFFPLSFGMSEREPSVTSQGLTTVLVSTLYLVLAYMSAYLPRYIPCLLLFFFQILIFKLSIFLEGWHSGFQTELRKSSKNIFRQIEAIKKELLSKKFRLNQLRTGHQPNKKKMVYAQMDARLKTIVMRYENTDRLEYLRACGYNVRY